MLAVLVVLVVVAPIAWLASEFQSKRWLRLVLGLLALFGAYWGGALWEVVNGFGENSYFGAANEEFIQATLQALEQGRHDQVLVALREFDRVYQPSYENRAGYQGLVEQYAQTLATDHADDTPSPASR